MQFAALRCRGFIQKLAAAIAVAAICIGQMAPMRSARADAATRTPIKHLIIILGENRSFDHVFATYRPKAGETIANLLSKGIVKADGTPGPHYGDALQVQATDTKTYELSPTKTGPYTILPPAVAGGPSSPWLCQTLHAAAGTSCETASNLKAARTIETGLPEDYDRLLLTGGTGQTRNVPDARIHYAGKDASHLPSGPYQLTSATLPYDSYTASPVHRFYQMWQQLDCDAAQGLRAKQGLHANPSGCRADLFPWVEVTVGRGSNGEPRSANFTDLTTRDGSTAMSFYNMEAGDAPYLKALADAYSMSDNYHQAALGGTGANHIMLGTGDMIWFSDANGSPAVPPSGQIENPNPQPGTNNFYIQDGYGGGSYSICADPSQPGVAPILNYLSRQSDKIDPRCEAGHYYLLNNYNPGYFGDGSNAYTDRDPRNATLTVPPSRLRTIGDALSEKQIAWAYYGEDWNKYLKDKYGEGWKTYTDTYCNICNWAQYVTSIMTDPAARSAHLKDTSDLYAAIVHGDLPAVAYVKPSGLVDGHPDESKLILFEGFAQKIVEAVKANPDLWADTAIIVTFDEGGGYWDSGYVQPLDFFGDGTRIPMIVVSKYSTGGHVSHTYTDHVSLLKFIEANWHLDPITKRSRDNLPNPVAAPSNSYEPVNGPAIGDLMDMFHF
jgi:phospholipase C